MKFRVKWFFSNWILCDVNGGRPRTVLGARRSYERGTFKPAEKWGVVRWTISPITSITCGLQASESF